MTDNILQAITPNTAFADYWFSWVFNYPLNSEAVSIIRARIAMYSPLPNAAIPFAEGIQADPTAPPISMPDSGDDEDTDSGMTQEEHDEWEAAYWRLVDREILEKYYREDSGKEIGFTEEDIADIDLLYAQVAGVEAYHEDDEPFRIHPAFQ